MRGVGLVSSFCLVVLVSLANAEPDNPIGLRRYEAEDPKFRLYTRETRDPNREKRVDYDNLVTDDEDSVDESSLNPRSHTVVVVHGFTEDATTATWMKDIMNKRLDKEPCNVILVDWEYLAGSMNSLPYIGASSNTRRVGEDLSNLLNFLKDYKGLSIEQTHIIGFSLGSHVAGVAGYQLKQVGRPLGRITGLDPAGPLFEDWMSKLCNVELSDKLDSSDATFVDVIRTNEDIYGCSVKNGQLAHVDFFMNHASTQPGCKGGFSSCSHGRAHDYYVESLTSGPSYGFLYDNYKKNKTDSCLNSTRNNVGFSVTQNPSGAFYAKTEDKSLYLANGSLVIRLKVTKNDNVADSIGQVKVKVWTDSDWAEMWRCGVQESEYSGVVIIPKGKSYDNSPQIEVCFEKNWEQQKTQVKIEAFKRDKYSVDEKEVIPTSCPHGLPVWAWVLIGLGIFIGQIIIIGAIIIFTRTMPRHNRGYNALFAIL